MHSQFFVIEDMTGIYVCMMQLTTAVFGSHASDSACASV